MFFVVGEVTLSKEAPLLVDLSMFPEIPATINTPEPVRSSEVTVDPVIPDESSLPPQEIMTEDKTIIKKAYNTFTHNHLVVKTIDKKAYLSALSLADIILVTCDSTSMISEAAITCKPIYIVNMQTKRDNYRFKNFYSLFKKMKIIKDLDEFKGGIDLWTYKQLDETKRIAPIIRDKMKQNGII